MSATNDLPGLRVFVKVIVEELFQFGLCEIGGKHQIRIRRAQPVVNPTSKRSIRLLPP
jgi:hypothetical protein